MSMDYDDDFSGANTNDSVKLTYGYYRQPNGWIKPAVVTDLEELQYRKEGWEPLPRYGRLEMMTRYSANHPLEQLFVSGGAKELPVEQILQQGLYINPPLVPTCRQSLNQYHKGHAASCWNGAKPVHFPQLDGIEFAGPFPCSVCGIAKPTIAARDQHEMVAHKDEKGDIRTGQVLAEAMLKGLSPQVGNTTSTVLLAEVESLRRQLADARRRPAAPRRSRSKAKEAVNA